MAVSISNSVPVNVSVVATSGTGGVDLIVQSKVCTWIHGHFVLSCFALDIIPQQFLPQQVILEWSALRLTYRTPKYCLHLLLHKQQIPHYQTPLLVCMPYHILHLNLLSSHKSHLTRNLNMGRPSAYQCSFCVSLVVQKDGQQLCLCVCNGIVCRFGHRRSFSACTPCAGISTLAHLRKQNIYHCDLTSVQIK